MLLVRVGAQGSFQAHLEVTYDHGGTRITRLQLPNQVSYNHHRDEPVIRNFLEQRGFLDGPMRFEMAS